MQVLTLYQAIFWITVIVFITNVDSFLKLFIFSEITWITLFILSILFGLANDDLNLLTLSFFLLGFATVEFVVAYLLIILFKKNNIDLNFWTNDAKYHSFLLFNLKKLSSTKQKWN